MFNGVLIGVSYQSATHSGKRLTFRAHVWSFPSINLVFTSMIVKTIP